MNITELLNLAHNEYPYFKFKDYLNSFISSSLYQPYHENLINLKNDINFFLKSNNYIKLIETCYKIFLINPFDIESHIISSRAAKKLDKTQLDKIHSHIASNLLDLILESGNGSCYDDAYVIHFPEDEIAVFTYFQNYPINRINQDKNKRIYDIYSMQKGNNIFFDVTIPFMTISGEK